MEGLFIIFAYKSKRIREHVRLLHDNLLHRVQRGNFHEHITVPTCQVWTANILHEYHSSLNVSKAILHKCKLKGNRNVCFFPWNSWDCDGICVVAVTYTSSITHEPPTLHYLTEPDVKGQSMDICTVLVLFQSYPYNHQRNPTTARCCIHI